MNYIDLLLGILIGAVLTWSWFKVKKSENNVSGDELSALKVTIARLEEQKILSETRLAEQRQISESREIELKKEADEQRRLLKEDFDAERKRIKEGQEAGRQQLKEEFEIERKSLKEEFENLSNKIFDEKSGRFISLNEEKVAGILKPLQEKIKNFEDKIDKNYTEEIRERTSLKKELEKITELNKKLSDDALQLASALKGDKKLQGDWGEAQLEQILNYSGLEEDIHYLKQANFKDEDGRNQRPDFVIKLPENKHVIIDSKVSLVAYEKYFHSEDENEKKLHLKTHISNIQTHIKQLSAKDYNNLHDINTPDYVLMFVAIEPALYAALKEDSSLQENALNHNIVLVSSSTILATLRLISFIWKQENQRKNVGEIARESGALYDKFVGFIADMESMGKKIEGLQGDYNNSLNKLSESKKKGDTILGRMERIKKLGADTGKSIPESFLKAIDE